MSTALHTAWLHTGSNIGDRAENLRAALARVTQRAFSLRRKVLRHSLGKMFSETELAGCGISDRQRPEEVSVSQYLALAKLSLDRLDEP